MHFTLQFPNTKMYVDFQNKYNFYNRNTLHVYFTIQVAQLWQRDCATSRRF